jgi:hypothetical protein
LNRLRGLATASVPHRRAVERPSRTFRTHGMVADDTRQLYLPAHRETLRLLDVMPA